MQPATEPGTAATRVPWWDKLNHALFPYLGPPPLGPGPGGEPPVSTAPPVCPLCGTLMTLHEIERATGTRTPTRLHCPA